MSSRLPLAVTVASAAVAVVFALTGCTGAATTPASTTPVIVPTGGASTGGASTHGTSSGSGTESGSGAATDGSSSGTGTTAGGAQTKAEACTILANSLQTVSSGLQTAYTTLQTNPTKAVAQLEAAATMFQASISTVTAPDAKALSDKANADLRTLVTETKGVLSNPLAGTSAAEKQATVIEGDLTAIGTYCK